MNTRDYLETREQLSRAKADFDRETFGGCLLTRTERLARQTAWDAFTDRWLLVAQRLRAYEELQAEIALRLSLIRGKKSA